MTRRLTILGCGSSGGVPRIGGLWGQCDPSNPKNRRRRCSVLVESVTRNGKAAVLVDTPPDLRDQLLGVRADRLDGVLYTHDHADHTHGIDDLRAIAFGMKKRIDVYGDAATMESLTRRFDYCFRPQPNYRPILNAHVLAAGQTVAFGDLQAVAVPQAHGPMGSLGFRFADVAYSPDVSDIADDGVALLRNLDVWIVDALRFTPHPSHFHVRRTLEWIERVGARRAILTHMTPDLDYEALRRELPPHVEPAYDGMVVEFD